MEKLGPFGGLAALGMAIYVVLALISGFVARTDAQSATRSEAVAARLHIEAQELSRPK